MELLLCEMFIKMCFDILPKQHVRDLVGRTWTFKLFYIFDNQEYVILEDYAHFVTEKSLQVGDIMVFVTDRITIKTLLVVRRLHHSVENEII